jgi:hypothetical protein
MSSIPLLVILGLTIWLAIRAWHGRGTRGVYFALAFVGLLVAAVFNDGLRGLPTENYTADRLRSLSAFFDVLFGIGAGLVGGGILGACLFRQTAHA